MCRQQQVAAQFLTYIIIKIYIQRACFVIVNCTGNLKIIVSVSKLNSKYSQVQSTLQNKPMICDCFSGIKSNLLSRIRYFQGQTLRCVLRSVLMQAFALTLVSNVAHTAGQLCASASAVWPFRAVDVPATAQR